MKHAILGPQLPRKVSRHARDDHDRNVARLRMRREFIADRKSIQRWQQNIEQQQIRRIGFNDSQRGHAIVCLLDAETGPEQRVSEDAT